jgi:hypothetical protein
LPDLLTQPEIVVWSPAEAPVDVAAAPLWSLGVVDDGAVPWSVLDAAPGVLEVEPELLLPACANVMPAVMSRILVK